MSQFSSKFVSVDGIRTHYLEAGAGPDLILLHSGEFGGCARLSWERTIPALARHFRVLAPDWVGYGESEKLFSFEDMWGFRVRHITGFAKVMGVERAHFIGNSFGGTMLLAVAAMSPMPWPIDRLIAIAGGGSVPENAARDVLNNYDGTTDAMRALLRTMFVDAAISEDPEYLERRQAEALRPGAWEATAAVRFKAPWRVAKAMPPKPDYGSISRPTLLVTGGQDCLRPVGFGKALQAEIPNSKLHSIVDAGHCPHIERPDEFAAVALPFLGVEAP